MLSVSCQQSATKKTGNGNPDFTEYQIDDTRYELPYGIPEEREIRNTILKVCNKILSSTAYSVINKRTGQRVTDFTIIDSSIVVDTRMGDFNLWDYSVGVIHTGMFSAGRILKDERFLAYPVKNYNFIFEHLPYFREKDKRYGAKYGGFHRIINMSSLDHCGSIGAALIEAYQYNQDYRYREMIDTVSDYIMHRQFRLSDGTLARQRPQKESLWTDDFYMCIPFLVRMGKLTGDTKYYDEALKQAVQLSSHLFVWEKQLYDHGWNANAGEYDPNIFWGRANGWAMMAMTTLLDVLPQDYPGREKILTIYRAHIKGVSELQSSNGLWFNILDKNDTYPESSCSAMFVYSIAKAVNEGWIDHTYASVALAGWNGLTMYITPEGEIENMCAGTTFSADMVYYYHRPASREALHGYGPVLLAGSETIRLINNPNLRFIKEYRTVHTRLVNR